MSQRRWCDQCDREVGLSPNHAADLMGCLVGAVALVAAPSTCGASLVLLFPVILVAAIVGRADGSVATQCPICKIATISTAQKHRRDNPNAYRTKRDTKSDNRFWVIAIPTLMGVSAVTGSIFLCLSLPPMPKQSSGGQRVLSSQPTAKWRNPVDGGYIEGPLDFKGHDYYFEQLSVPAGQELSWTGGIHNTVTKGVMLQHNLMDSMVQWPDTDAHDADKIGGLALGIFIWCEDDKTRAAVIVRGCAELTPNARNRLTFDDGSTFDLRLSKTTLVDKIPPRYSNEVTNPISFAKALMGKKSASGTWRKRGFTQPLDLNFGAGEGFEIKFDVRLDGALKEVRTACHW